MSYYEESGILLVMDDLPGFGANGMRNDTCRACRGIDPESWGVGEYLDAFGGVGGIFGTDLETRSYLINSKGQALELLGEDFLKRYPDYSSVDYTRYSLILTWC